MRRKKRKYLMPFAWTYAQIMSLRAWMYHKKLLASTSYAHGVVGIGNLAMGGTGKTQLVDFIIQSLKKNHTIAVLSRGYKRQSTGYVQATAKSSIADLGDESFMLYNNHKEIHLSVSKRRRMAIKKIRLLKPTPDLIICDDIFQHLSVSPTLNILLTRYDDPYFEDCVFPCGSLRETKNGAKRADIIVVTKCPNNLCQTKKLAFIHQLQLLPHQQIFFTKTYYETLLYNSFGEEISLKQLTDETILLVTGIADCTDLKRYLDTNNIQFEHLRFADHYNYTSLDIKKIISRANKRIVVTTEKDFVKLNMLTKHTKLYSLKVRLDFFSTTDKEQLLTCTKKAIRSKKNSKTNSQLPNFTYQVITKNWALCFLNYFNTSIPFFTMFIALYWDGLMLFVFRLFINIC